MSKVGKEDSKSSVESFGQNSVESPGQSLVVSSGQNKVCEVGHRIHSHRNVLSSSKLHNELQDPLIVTRYFRRQNRQDGE